MHYGSNATASTPTPTTVNGYGRCRHGSCRAKLAYARHYTYMVISMDCGFQSGSLGLLLGTEAPVMTLDGVDFLYL